MRTEIAALAELVEPIKPAQLQETWLDALPLGRVLCRTTAPQSPRWPCAVNTQRRVLFTQLISDSWLMRDGYYEYLLAIDEDLLVIALESGRARLLRVGAWTKFPREVVIALADKGATIVTVAKQPFQWSDAVAPNPSLQPTRYGLRPLRAARLKR